MSTPDLEREAARRIVAEHAAHEPSAKLEDAIALALSSASAGWKHEDIVHYQEALVAARAAGIEECATLLERERQYPCWDQVAAQLRALSSQPSLSEWRTMESAPKDGTPVLLYTTERCENCGPSGMIIARWVGFWKAGTLRNGEPVKYSHEPTHWQPLPSPPSPELRKGDEPK